MTTSYARLKINHNGVLGIGGQTFSWGLNLICVAPDDEADLQDLLGDIVGAFNGIIGPNVWVKGWLDTGSNYVDLSGYYYPAGSDTASLQSSFGFPSFAGSGTGSLPYQTCAVVSLLTGRSGRHNRGRCFIPATGKALTNNQFTSAMALELGVDTANYLSAINALTFHSAPVTVIVASTASSTGIPVTAVRVDSRADIQRRRADKQAATYSFDSDVTV